MLYARVTTLEMLESGDPNQRCQACNELQAAKSLSIDDIQALMKATGDLYPEVAAAARKALFVHGQAYSASDFNPPRPSKLSKVKLKPNPLHGVILHGKERPWLSWCIRGSDGLYPGYF